MADPLADLRACLPQGFEVDASLGAGGQGAVFRGRCQGKPAALKFFNPAGDPRRLARELELLKSTNCPYLVAVIDVADVQLNGVATTVVAYELHNGGDLRQLLEAAAPSLDAAELVRLGQQVGMAVDVLWSKRIVHRDIKPANIVRADDGRFVLVDVGLARHVDRSALTAFGLVAGTPGYMSPEQAAGRRNLTVHSDAFSLGITMYELASKAHPFGHAQGNVGVLTPANLSTRRQDLPLKLCRAIHDLMTVSPALRPKLIADHFRAILGGA